VGFIKSIFGEKDTPKAPVHKAKKKFTSFGNCQAQPIAQLLLQNEKFSEQFEYIPFPKPVFMLTESDFDAVAELVSSVDLFVQQSVGEAFGKMYSTENLNTLTKPTCQNISFPSIYFTGYSPEISYLRIVGGNINEFSDYHDVNLLNLFLSEPGRDIEQCIELYRNNDYYSQQQVLKNATLSLAKLREKEANSLTKSVGFIEEHWQKERLFFSMNHPSRALLKHVVGQIHRLLGIPVQSDAGNFQYLGESILPIYGAISRHLSFANSEQLKMRGKPISLEEYVKNHIAVYKQADEAKLKHNLLYVKKSGEGILNEIITAV
jgi:hypothetical protein